MQLLFAYLLKLSFCLALGYLFYFLLLRHMTWYTWNRYFLLFFPLVAIVIPALPVELPREVQSFKVDFFVTDLSASAVANVDGAQAASSWSIINILLVIMFAGMLFFLARFAIRLYALYKTRASASLLQDGDVKLYHLKGCPAPFSFYNSIYIDTNNYEPAELEKILAHELVHITQKHTLDTLVSEWLCILQWFNPFVWLMKHAIKQNLEFIADDSVLQKGVSRKGYQYLLLKVSGAMPHSIANNLLFPSLKKRIHMMNKTKTRKVHLLKFMCLLPLGCLLFFSFSGPAAHPPARNTSVDAFSLSKLSFYINDEKVAQLVRNDQNNSLLKEGGPLSLSLISEEKTRLRALLEKNGYLNLDEHSISFVMDSAINKKSFSVQVAINIDKSKKYFKQNDKPGYDQTAIKRSTDHTDLRYAIATVAKKDITAAQINNTQKSKHQPTSLPVVKQ